MKHVFTALLTTILLSVACRNESSPDKSYTLDFGPSPESGKRVGSLINIAFAVSTSQTVRVIELPVSAGWAQLPGISKTNDLSGCENQSAAWGWEEQTQLARSTAAKVKTVELELGTIAEPTWKGAMCFGYRDSGGVWHWNFKQTPFVRNDRGVYTARVDLGGVAADAVKLVFSQEMTGAPLEKIHYVVEQ